MSSDLKTISYTVGGGKITITEPDFANLFEQGGCDDKCGKCLECQMWAGVDDVLTPRAAAFMYQTAGMLSENYTDDARRGYTFTNRALPRICEMLPSEFFDRFVLGFSWVRECIAAGKSPKPDTIARQMLMHRLLDEMNERIEDRDAGVNDSPLIFAEVLDLLPKHPSDENVWRMRDLLLDNVNVLLLFDPSLDGIEDSHEAAQAGVRNLHPSQWFEKL